MNLLFYWTRYMLVLLPSVATMYASHAIGSYSVYIFEILILLWVVQLNVKWLPERLRPIFLCAEAGFAGWLCYRYGGVLFLVFCSILISLFQLKERLQLFLFVAFLITMNVVMMDRSLPNIFIANIVLATSAVLLSQVQSTFGQKAEIELLYDELRRKHYDLDEARKRIVEYAKKVEQLAQAEERTRISRDIHDELGHKLIRLKMMMEAAIQIFPSQQQKGMDMIHQVRDQLTDSMETLRMTLRKMKPDEGEVNRYSIERLIEQFGSDSGLSVHYELTGLPYPLYPSEEFVLYRNAQEAITNAIRHGGATEVRILVRYEPHQIRMTVTNNGIVTNESHGKGLGLSGMEERIRLLGGELIVETDTQFTVTTVLPHREEA